jgi:hypothetical protein
MFHLKNCLSNLIHRERSGLTRSHFPIATLVLYLSSLYAIAGVGHPGVVFARLVPLERKARGSAAVLQCAMTATDAWA